MLKKSINIKYARVFYIQNSKERNLKPWSIRFYEVRIGGCGNSHHYMARATEFTRTWHEITRTSTSILYVLRVISDIKENAKM